MLGAAAALLAAGGGGCGSGDDDARRQVAADLRAAQRAFAAGRVDELCAALTARARFELGNAAHFEGTPCRQAASQYVRPIRDGTSFEDARRTAVEVSGDRATVALVPASGHRYDVELEHEDGRWRIDSFFPLSPVAARGWAAAQPRQEFPAPGNAGVEVRDESGEVCPAIELARGVDVSGGCRFEVAAPRPVPMLISTPLGEFDLSECLLTYEAHVDGQGRTWSPGLRLDLTPGERGGLDACGDLNTCGAGAKPGELAEESWDDRLALPGRLYSDGEGGFVHAISVCFSTCVGYHVGVLEVGLARAGGGWRGRVADESIGRTGFRFTTPVRLRAPRGMRLRALRYGGGA